MMVRHGILALSLMLLGCSVRTGFLYPELRVELRDRSGRPARDVYVSVAYSDRRVQAALPAFVAAGQPPEWRAVPLQAGVLRLGRATDRSGVAEVEIPDMWYGFLDWELPFLATDSDPVPIPDLEIRVVATHSDGSGSEQLARYEFHGDDRTFSPLDACEAPVMRLDSDSSGVGSVLAFELRCSLPLDASEYE